jgi:transposase
LDVVLTPAGARIEVTRDPAGYEELVKWLRLHKVRRVGFEASGGYEQSLQWALEDHGFEVNLHNAHSVRMFAKSLRRMAKNDRADALTIAEFTTYRAKQKPSPCRRDLNPLIELLRVRSQYKDWITDCVNRLEHTTDPALREIIQEQRGLFVQQKKLLDRKLAAAIAANKQWRQLEHQLRGAPGVGAVLSNTLIARLPELGTLTRRKIASLCGVAPFDDDSGQRRGERHIAGGRDDIRAALYMATTVAIRCNPAIAAFAARLQGKKPKVIITACMRKLLVMLNAMVRDGTEWRQQMATA